MNENDSLMQEFLNSNKLLLEKIDNLEKSNKEILDKLNKNTKDSSSPITEPRTTTGLNTPLATIYNGFRWLFVDKDVDANIITTQTTQTTQTKQTKQTKIQNLGYIAKMDKEKTGFLAELKAKQAEGLKKFTPPEVLRESLPKTEPKTVPKTEKLKSPSERLNLIEELKREQAKRAMKKTLPIELFEANL